MNSTRLYKIIKNYLETLHVFISYFTDCILFSKPTLLSVGSSIEAISISVNSAVLRLILLFKTINKSNLSLKIGSTWLSLNRNKLNTQLILLQQRLLLEAIKLIQRTIVYNYTKINLDNQIYLLKTVRKIKII